MNYKKLKNDIIRCINKQPEDLSPYRDLYTIICEVGQEDFDSAYLMNLELRDKLKTGSSAAFASDNFEALRDFSELEFKSLVFGSKNFFDDYLQAVEYWKPYNKKFYLPRRRYLKRYVDDYQRLLEGDLDFLSVSMPKRSGKALTLDTLIPTPFGFKRMGDIKKGDLVMARDGYDTKVVEVFPQGKVPVYEVAFSDGAVIKTCGNHLWKVKKHNWNAPRTKEQYVECVMSTKAILDSGLHSGGKNNHRLFAVEYAEPAEFLFRDVKLDPYILGILLGDGSFVGGAVRYTSFDREISDYVSQNLPEGDVLRHASETRGIWVIKSNERKTDEHGYMMKSATAQALEYYGLLGCHSWDKFVPEDYLYNTSIMRMELLRGLLDTDGYCTKNHIEYSTTSPMLRDAVMFLVRSLGGRASCKERMGRYTKDGVVHETRMNYRVNIQFPCGDSPFRISRHKDAYKPQRDKLYRYIESITPCGEEEAQCICVDNDEHLYLVGEYFVPTHNSTLGINFACMLAGLYPDKSILMEGTGDDLVKSFYNGCLEYLQTESEYSYYDIFTGRRVVQTNYESKIVNLDNRSRFPTIMCRSIDARQVGLSEATSLLYLDDCVEGREEAKNRQRLDDKWEVISGDILGRAIEGTPIVICGTRYSIYDPIGRLQEEMLKQGKRIKIIETPALDPITDESNFEFELDGQKIFTTKYFRDQRSMLSEEQWESEFQQQPFEAKGVLFPKKDLNYYFKLPVDVEPDAIMAFCDTADGGGDYCAMPVLAVYGQDVYMVDAMFDDSPASATKSECARLLMDNRVVSVTFESNNAGSYFAQDVQKLLDANGFTCSVRTRRTLSNKQTRIEFASDNILKHFWFKDPSTYKRGSQYDKFMRNLTGYTRTGKVKHDDAPDALAMAENELRKRVVVKVETFQRPW